MPLDRRITIERLSETTVNDFGEDVPGTWSTLAAVWAERRYFGTVDVSLTEGVVTAANVSWIVRWRSDLLATDIARLRILDANGTYWNPENIAEIGGRRAFVSISAVSSDA